jgi:putative membrane protein
MVRISATASLIVALGFAVPAVGQTPPAGNAPAAPTPGTPKLNAADTGFAHDAAIGGMAEVELGKLAGSKAQDDAVRAFARRMVEDHGKANNQLAAIAKDANGAVPTELDQEHKDVRKSLDGLSGAGFDRAYIDAQVKDHQTAAQLFAAEVDGGYNAELKSFAGATLPTIHEHLAMARELQMKLPAPVPAAPLTGSSVAPSSASQRDGAATRDLNREQLEKKEPAAASGRRK